MANKTMHHAVIGADTFELIDEAGREETSQLKNALITDSTSGAIASFPDGGDGFAVRGLKVQMEPIQDLHGQANPYPAGGGVNKFGDYTVVNAYMDGSGKLSGSSSDRAYIIKVRPSTQYAYKIVRVPQSSSSVNDDYQIGEFYGNNIPEIGETGARLLANSFSDNIGAGTFTTSANAKWVAIKLANTVKTKAEETASSVQVEIGNTVSPTYSPYSNICPISGRSAVTVTRTGFNVWDEEWEVGTYDNTNGEKVAISNRIRSKNYIPCIPSTTYYYMYGGSISGIKFRICYYDADKTFIRADNDMTVNYAYITPSNARFLTLALLGADITTYNHDISINYPSTDHDYHAYQGQTVTIQLGQTVYGGTLDVTNGALTVDRGIVDLGTLTWNAVNSNFFFADITGMKVNVTTEKCSAYATVNTYSNYNFADKSVSISQYIGRVAVHDSAYSDATAFKTAMNGVQLCYELAIPITVQLTAQQMTTLLGQNNVWSDADSVSVDYVADTKLYINKVIAEALS